MIADIQNMELLVKYFLGDLMKNNIKVLTTSAVLPPMIRLYSLRTAALIASSNLRPPITISPCRGM